MMVVSAVLAALLAGAPAASIPAPPDPALEVYAHPKNLVTLPDGRRLDLYCTGHGSPTVILESGWTADLVTWRYV